MISSCLLIKDENKLSGTIPIELGELTELENLFLSENQITGTIPVELGELTKLTKLNLGM
jgi:Leucine-rich repeat (LRR) protein